MIDETCVFLKTKAKIDRKRLSKSRYSKKIQARLVRRKKLFVKNFCHKKQDLSISCLLKESALILEQASRSYGRLKLSVFVTK